MILYDSLLEMHMPRYGIGIPISASRSQRILDSLEGAFPVLSLSAAAAGLGLDSPLLSRQDLERVHDRAFIERLYTGGPGGLEKELLTCFELINEDGSYRRYKPAEAERPLGDLFRTLLYQVSGTYLACRLALEDTAPIPHFCYYLGGGQHHARYDMGSGFCLFNDVILAARKLQAEERASLIWIIDVDAHKGDGSAELVTFSRNRGETFSGKNPEIIPLSVHMAAGWPLDRESLAKAEQGRAPLAASDIDIPIAEGEEACYNPRLAGGLAEIERRSGGRIPELAIVVDGADVYEKDGLASSNGLRLSREQCLERDRLILAFLQKRHIPSAWLMAGGYGEDAWEPTANFLRSLH
ncbi:histone deacetylase [Spirochaetia bacterium]|nr:histone deacetylase [Spirochaetia bacterium]